MDTWMGRNYDPVTLHKYLYANADPGNMVDPTGNFSIGSVMTAVNVTATLVGTAQSAYSVFKVATGQEELDARALGTEILLTMLGGSAGKVIKMLPKGTQDSLRDSFDGVRCFFNSFPAGTLVHTEGGLIPIEEIEIGDKVLSFDQESGETSYQEVTHLIRGDKEY